MTRFRFELMRWLPVNRDGFPIQYGHSQKVKNKKGTLVLQAQGHAFRAGSRPGCSAARVLRGGGTSYCAWGCFRDFVCGPLRWTAEGDAPRSTYAPVASSSTSTTSSIVISTG